MASDLQLESLADNLSIVTEWGKRAFKERLLNCNSNKSDIKRIQLPLFALKQEPAVVNVIRQSLEKVNPSLVDDCLHSTDSRIQESVTQILWKKDSFGAFLNSSPTVLNALITWKTIVLPGFAVVMPLLALIVPYFVLRYMNPISTNDYLEHVKTVLLQQVSIPSFLKARGSHDRIGFVLESLFIGLTLALFVSSLWNQITTAQHLRHIWFDIESRGQALQGMIVCASNILTQCKSLPLRRQKALRYVIEEGEAALDAASNLVGLDGVSTFGAVWNDGAGLVRITAWLGHVDVLCGILQKNVCFPRIAAGPSLDIRGVYHPGLPTCVANDYTSSGHTILTGPNRGGKSTFCRAVGLALVTAQSWGFAWATSMTWRPFTAILTALEPCGKLGIQSTFEGEIEFAKDVLTAARAHAHAPAAASPAAEKGSIFVMMDEIFHSTNASDGVAASTVFLEQLYAEKNVTSVISTHYRHLAEHFKDTAAAYQMVAHSKPDMTLTYTYKAELGISDKSSVMEILIERGLAPARRAVEA